MSRVDMQMYREHRRDLVTARNHTVMPPPPHTYLRNTHLAAGDCSALPPPPPPHARPSFYSTANPSAFVVHKRRFDRNSYGGRGRRRQQAEGNMQQLIAPDRYLARAGESAVSGEAPHDLLTGGVFDGLSCAVWQRFIGSQQTVTTYREKLQLWKSLYILIKSHYPRYGLFLVGSTVTGFGSNISDIDMCLLVRNTDMDQRCEAVVHLEIVQKLLKQCDFISDVELIQAKVPILKFRRRGRNLDVDLNCNNSVGIRNSHLLRCYAHMDWRVRPLVVVVKLWARHHHINDAKHMTISSYSLALMVINFLQCGVRPPVVPCLQGIYPEKFARTIDVHHIDVHEMLAPFRSDNRQSLGQLFLRFLEYYAQFDYAQCAISVRLGACVSIEECRNGRSLKNDPHQWKLLCVEEPFDLTNTARSVYDPEVFARVRAVFQRSHHTLAATRDLDSVFADSYM